MLTFSVRKTTTFLFLLTVLVLIPARVFSQTSGGSSSEDVLAKLRQIEDRIKKVEANQQETINRQDKILAELDRLRVWVHRR